MSFKRENINSLSSAFTDYFVEELQGFTQFLWIGLSDSTRKWNWIDESLGEPYLNWDSATGEPNKIDEHCALVSVLYLINI